MSSFMDGTTPETDADYQVPFSMPDVTVGDINEMIPKRILDPIKDFARQIDKVLPGFTHPNNSVYAPSFDMGWSKVKLNEKFHTTAPNVYVGGDVTGHFRGALQACVSGLLISRDILENTE
jgi:uncharacterized protein